MAEEKNTTAVPLNVAALDCGVRVGGGLVAVLAFAGSVGWVIEHWPAITDALATAWSELLRAASLGGHSFWFAVGGGVTTMAAAAWGVCVNCKTTARLPTALNVVGALGCSIIWFVFFRAAANTFGEFSDLSPYKGVAFVLMCGPWLALVLSVMALAGMLFEAVGFGVH